jgi:hypothetical protein
MIITPRRRRPQARLVEPRNSTAIPVEGSVSPADLGVGLIVEYADTADMDDGQPLPPLILDGVVWRVVRRLAGARTRWCRIALAENPARPDRRQVARDFLSRRQTRHQNS